MKVTEFLQKNIAWNVHKNTFAELCCPATTEEQLFCQLQRLADRYFPQHKMVETTYTEFCLNQVALSIAKRPVEKCIKQHFNEYWQSFLRVKALFAKNFMNFPSDGKRTRLEYIAELIAKCTQFALSDAEVTQICLRTKDIFHLEGREERNLQNVIDLYKINYFCALAQQADAPTASARLAKMLDEKPLKTEFLPNTNLRHAYFSTLKIVANVDCLGNSATKFNMPTAVDFKPYFYINGKNVFDTFCHSKFGVCTAEFYSQTATLKVSQQYFLEGKREIRRFAVKNLGKGTKNLVTDFLLRQTNPSCKRTFFQAEGALCLSVEGEENFYCALAVVCNNKILSCPFEEGRVSHKFVLRNKVLKFDVVTVFAENMPTLFEELSALNCFGTTRCPYVYDCASENTVNFKTPLNVTPHGYNKRFVPQKEADTLNFTYQLGNDNVGTFLDNAGNCTTLINGFAFGVAGEKVYSVKNGTIEQLNCDKFTLQAENILYKKPNGAVCAVLHNAEKTYDIHYATETKTLFYFPLEESCRVEFADNTFTVTSRLRKFALRCFGKVESYTTNTIECNPERLRYKLSCEAEAGTCLAICFAAAKNVQLAISPFCQIATPQPLVRESLVSTYLNYVNNKNVFCLNNFLKRADSLTLAAINFTNPQFVKHYVLNILDKNIFYYDVTGRPKKFFDKLAMPLAVVYYLGMNEDDISEELKHHIRGIMFNEAFEGRSICIKALLLKKAAHLKGFDKVRCLIEYNNVKKIIVSDPKLFGYAQAIGAVPMLHPSKERLKDLCTKYDIPKSWYYVSQLENLYGLSFVDGVLNFTPKVTQENVLEQLAITVAGKRIETSFAKSTVQSMTLNGVQYFVPFKPQNLKKQNNTLVVRY